MNRLPIHRLGAWTAVLVWCGVAGWFAFVRGTRIPVLGFLDFGFHELGHMVMYIIPINQVLTAAMGSISQCAIPLGIGAYFWIARRDDVGATVCLAWSAANFQDVSVYIADAPVQQLELVGGEHDWAFTLGPEHFNRLESAQTIANVTRTAGLVLLLVAVVIAVRGLLFSFGATDSAVTDSSSATEVPAAATAWTPDDRFPSR